VSEDGCLKTGREARLKPASSREKGLSFHQLKLVANYRSAEADQMNATG